MLPITVQCNYSSNSTVYMSIPPNTLKKTLQLPLMILFYFLQNMSLPLYNDYDVRGTGPDYGI